MVALRIHTLRSDILLRFIYLQASNGNIGARVRRGARRAARARQARDGNSLILLIIFFTTGGGRNLSWSLSLAVPTKIQAVDASPREWVT